MKDGVKTVGSADMAALFAAGAYSAAASRGLSDKTAERIAAGVCKSASSRPGGEDTLWARNKSWLLPTIIGGLAFWAGASGERNGRPDRGYFVNSMENIWRRVKYLLGANDDNPTFDAATRIERGGSGSGSAGGEEDREDK